jgi:sugar phosphate isomerase/epimerase
MPPLRLAVATRCFQQPQRQAVRTAADAGAAGVELDVRNEVSAGGLSETGRRQLLHYLDENRLVVAATTFPLRTSLADPERLDARVAAVKQAMELSYGLKARVMTVRLGRVPAEPDSAARQAAIEVLNDLARHANRVGTTLALTPARQDPQAVQSIVAAVTEGPVGVHFDPAVFVLAGHAVGEAFRLLHESVLHVQLRDAVGDVEGGGVEVPLGRGDVDWEELLALFDEAGYRGWLCAERTTGEDRVGDIERALMYVRNVGAR